jgi:NAD(P)-dependent dehydrogenase (short-subunit alcohol dehydrogenase family)
LEELMAEYLVVGGAGGLGLAVVTGLRDLGHGVIASVRNDDEAAIITRAHGAAVPTFMLDLGDSQSIAPAIRDALGSRSIDGVAVCAAISPLGILELAPLAEFETTLRVNVVSHLAIFQAAIPYLRASGGTLAFVSSMAGKVAMPFVGGYSASKFALEGLADAMRREVSHTGVRIALIEPGGIRTPMVDAQLEQVARMIGALDAEQDERYGMFHRGFQAAASASHNSTASTPEQIAVHVIAALTDAEPKTRYVAGDDAAQLIEAGKAMSDTEMDALMAQMMQGG